MVMKESFKGVDFQGFQDKFRVIKLTEHDAAHPWRNRIATKSSIVGVNAHPSENAQNPRFAIS